MNPQRWRQIDELFLAALEREDEERAAFLDEACAGDERLRSEVESLIVSHEQADTLIERQVFEAAAEMLAEDQSGLAAGQQIGHYQIIRLLGEGGMGEVYLARDRKLDRKIALKLLPACFTTDAERLRRFEQEACAASALNHPNILTIHEIEQVDKHHFIAMEYIEGETLRQRMLRSQLALRESLDIAIQIASALVAAHRAGVVHRDIKPENLMVREDGIVKVLDFGIAKLIEQPAAEPATGAKTHVKTHTGAVLGTSNYMSPEQARALAVDARTDIWSLGVVLYEMVAGRLPFEGPTTSDVIVSVLERGPLQLTRHVPDVPAELQRIVAKALRKNREERYQTIKDMLLDLKSLGRVLEIEAELGRSSPPESGVLTGALKSGETGGAGTEHLTSSGEYLVSEIIRHKRGMGIMLVTLLIAALGLTLYRFSGRSDHQQAAVPFQTTKITKLTTGNAFEPSISPDGKYVAYVLYEAGKQSIWIRQVAIASNVQLLPPADVRYWALTYSPDGNYIYYGKTEPNEANALYQIPALGGDAKKLLEGINSSIAFSPDGKKIAFVREAKEENALMIANADGTGAQKLASRRHPDAFWSGPAWSPNGRIIACGHTGSIRGIVEVRVEDGMVKPLAAQNWDFGELAWLSDGSGLLFNAIDQESTYFQLWHVSYPSGEARKITNSFDNYCSISLTADSRALVTQGWSVHSNVWVVPNGKTGRATQITSGSGSNYADLSWTPDGKILYSSDAGGNADIWVMNSDGTGRNQLTVDPAKDYQPIMSPDGRYIFFLTNRAGDFAIWRMNANGSDQKQLTTSRGARDAWAHCSPDGQWLVYTSFEPGGHPPRSSVWKISVEGGAPVLLNDRLTGYPVVSPDGKLIACWYKPDEATSWKLALIPFAGGPPVKVFDVAPTAAVMGIISWTADGRALDYLDSRGGVSNIWRQPLAGGKLVQLTDFKTEQIFTFAWSLDGKQLAASRGTTMSDIVLISDLK